MKVTLRYVTPMAADFIGEMAAICYDGKTDYIANTNRAKKCKKDSHFATMRFAHAVFNITGISRACANQMVRHKFLDFLQRSQRYCNEAESEFVNPFEDGTDAHRAASMLFEISNISYKELIDHGVKKEDARMVLPLAVTTELNVVGSLQAWHDFLYGNAGRLQKAAQGEIKDVARQIENLLSHACPELFEITGE